MGFYYQKNTKNLSAAKCGSKDFWKSIRLSSTPWNIDARRAILKAVENDDQEAMQQWMSHTDYRKFELKTLKDLKPAGKEKWKKKSDAKKLLAWADDLKKTLPAFEFCCYEFDEVKRKRKNKAGKMVDVTERPRQLIYCHLNGLVMLDIDHVDNPMEIWEKLQQNEALMARVVLVHLTSSGKGIRIIFTADINVGNLADNQIAFCEALGGGYTPDRSCLDATRNSFAPKEDEILFINEEKLFNYYDEEFDKKYTPLYRDKKTQPLYHQFPADDADGDAVHTQTTAVASANAPLGLPLATEGTQEQGTGEDGTMDAEPVENNHVIWRGYDLQSIIDQRYADKLPCEADSNRHTESLKLATDLLLMLDGDKTLVQQIVEAQPWVQEIIDERNENVAQTVESAAKQMAKREGDTSQPYPSTVMQKAIEQVTGKSYKQLHATKTADGLKPEDALVKQLEAWGAEIEALWDDFPMLKDVCAGLKPTQYPAALFTSGGILMTLMTRCWYRFYHKPQKERRLNCSLFVIGHPASGKSMADDLYKILAEPMVEADKAGKKALNEYKNSTKKKAANKEGKDKPKVTIRIHPARTANGQFITDMINAKENVNGKEIQLHMFTFDTELDNSITLQSGGSWINKMSMELKAFHNEEDGQMYMNLDSPIDSFDVTWNFIYTGTPIALKKKVTEKNFGSGLSTRLAVLPMPKTNFEMLDYEDEEHVDWERLKRMKEWAFKLDKRTGLLPVKPLVRHLWEWTKNRMEDCAEDNSEANELMLKRVAYHGLNYAAPFVDMRHWGSLHQDGKYWTGEYEVDETDWKLCELIARIQYATQQHFFGVMAEKYFDDMNSDVQVSGKRHRQKSVDGYNRLPDVFTKEDVIRCFGYDKVRSALKKISRLKDSKAIEEFKSEDRQTKYRKLAQMLV